MLIAQAQAENLPVATKEQIFKAYGVRRVWRLPIHRGLVGSAL